MLSQACDEVEKDGLEALWRGMPFDRLLAVNTNKYVNFTSEIDKEVYLVLIE